MLRYWLVKRLALAPSYVVVETQEGYEVTGTDDSYGS